MPDFMVWYGPRYASDLASISNNICQSTWPTLHLHCPEATVTIILKNMLLAQPGHTDSFETIYQQYVSRKISTYTLIPMILSTCYFVCIIAITQVLIVWRTLKWTLKQRYWVQSRAGEYFVKLTAGQGFKSNTFQIIFDTLMLFKVVITYEAIKI